MKRWDPERSIGILACEVGHLIGKIFDRRMQPMGLSRAQWFAIAHLRRRPGMAQGELAARMEVEDATAARLLDRMEAGGWVERRVDPLDRRKRRVYLTDKYDRVLQDMNEVVFSTREAVFAGLSADEQDRLIEMMRRLRSNAATLLLSEEQARGDAGRKSAAAAALGAGSADGLG